MQIIVFGRHCDVVQKLQPSLGKEGDAMLLLRAKRFSKGLCWVLIAATPVLMGFSACDTVFDLLVSPEVSVGTHEMSFTSVENGTFPNPQVTTAECTTSDSSTESVTDVDDCMIGLTSDQEWLKVAPESVTGHKEISVYANTTGLKAGTYTGTIHVEYAFVSIDDEEDIIVTLTITPQPADAAVEAESAVKNVLTPDVGVSAKTSEGVESVQPTESEVTAVPAVETRVEINDADRGDEIFRPEPATE